MFWRNLVFMTFEVTFLSYFRVSRTTITTDKNNWLTSTELVLEACSGMNDIVLPSPQEAAEWTTYILWVFPILNSCFCTHPSLSSTLYPTLPHQPPPPLHPPQTQVGQICWPDPFWWACPVSSWGPHSKDTTGALVHVDTSSSERSEEEGRGKSEEGRGGEGRGGKGREWGG